MHPIKYNTFKKYNGKDFNILRLKYNQNTINLNLSTK